MASKHASSDRLLEPAKRRWTLYGGLDDDIPKVDDRQKLKRRKSDNNFGADFRITFSFFLLTFLHFIMWWDRMSISAILPAMQTFFAVSDASAGLLQTTHNIATAIGLIIVGFAGDRFNRKRFLIICTLVWLGCTSTASFVPRNLFWLFCLLRAFSAIGFAALNVQGLALSADYFTGSTRGYAILVFNLSSLFGPILSMLVSARLLDSGVEWFWILRATPPIAAANIFLLWLFMPNAHKVEHASKNEGPTILVDLKEVIAVKTYRRVVVGSLLFGVYSRAAEFWGPTTFQRALEYRNSISGGQMDYSTFLTVTMVISLAACAIGTPINVVFAEKWTRGWACLGPNRRAIPYTICVLMLVGLTLKAASFLAQAGNLIVYWILHAVSSLLFGAPMPLYTQMILNVVPSNHRALAAALQTLMLTAIDAPTPMLLGAMSDALSGGSADPASRYYSLLGSLLAAIAIAAIFAPMAFLLAASSYPEDYGKVEDAEEDSPIIGVDESHSRFRTESVITI